MAFLVILLSAGFEWSLRRHAILPPGAAITVLPALIGLILITIVLQHLPRRHVEFRHAFAGASVTTAFWWGAKWIFGSTTPTRKGSPGASSTDPWEA